MGIEIERKFLISGNDWQKLPVLSHHAIRQGYLNLDAEQTVRVRIVGPEAFLTIKGKNRGAVRPEYEYHIPIEEAEEMMDQLCIQPIIEKERYRISYMDHTWEIDLFSGDNTGLIIAEIELKSPDQPFPLPDWLGTEVTGDRRYYNSNLVKKPFSSWKD